jgi:hypothetical protein
MAGRLAWTETRLLGPKDLGLQLRPESSAEFFTNLPFVAFRAHPSGEFASDDGSGRFMPHADSIPTARLFRTSLAEGVHRYIARIEVLGRMNFACGR